MDAFDVRELRYFLAVAEELNFSRAAERLGMAQPPLSRAIRQMERRLGADLFTRDTRQVSLTPVGATLLDEARYVLEAVSAATRRTRRAAQATPTLVATAKPGVATGMLQRIVNAYAALPGTPPVEIVVSGFGEQDDMVRDGRADIALLSLPFDQRGLDAEPLTTEPRMAALPADHRLARRGTLRCHDLHSEPMPRWPHATPAEAAYWTGRDTASSAQPSGPVVSDPTQLLEVVGLGQAVALIPAWLAEQNPRPDIAYRPVADASPYTIAIAWPEGTRAQPIAQFVRVATELHQAQPLAG